MEEKKLQENNYRSFLKKYIDLIRSKHSPIVKQIELPNKAKIRVSADGSKQTIAYVYKELEKMIEEVLGGWDKNNSSFLLVNSKHEIGSIDATFVHSHIFTIDQDKKEVFRELFSNEQAETEVYDFWFLLKAEPFFKIRNAQNIIKKINEKTYSKIDEILFKWKDVQESSLKKFNGNIDIYDLDIFQKEAFLNAINSDDVAIIKGPPGTGKTHTISKVIQYYFENKTKVIFASSLHSSLDSLVSKLNRNKVIVENAIVDRATRKIDSKIFLGQNKDKRSKNSDADIFITTLDSFYLHSYLSNIAQREKTVLIIDEASASSLFDVFSKTQFANKLIVVGDDAQFYPITSDREEKEMEKLGWDEEFKLFMKDSFFDILARKNRGSIKWLNVNYRSEMGLVNKFNIFYKNNLKFYKNNTHNEHINILDVDSMFELEKKIKKIKDENIGKNLICLTYYKENAKMFNNNPTISQTLGSDSLFKTTRSVQGKEADVVIIVLKPNENNREIDQLDFRTINVSISRAKQKVYVINYSSNRSLLNSKVIDNNQNLYKVSGDTYTLLEILTQNDAITKSEEHFEIDSNTSEINISNLENSPWTWEYFSGLEKRIENNQIYNGFKILDIRNHIFRTSQLHNFVENAQELSPSLRNEKIEVAFGKEAQEILELYLIDGLSIDKISKELHVDGIAISATLFFYGIKAGSKSRGMLKQNEISNLLIKQAIENNS